MNRVSLDAPLKYPYQAPDERLFRPFGREIFSGNRQPYRSRIGLRKWI